MAEVYSHLNPFAMTVGEKDFAMGFEYLYSLVEEYGLPVISSNLFRKDVALFPQYKIYQSNDISMGVIALIEESSLKLLPNYEKLLLKVEDPIQSAQKMIYELKKNKKVNYVILLSHLGLFQDKILAEKVSGIDMILGGHSEDVLKDPIMHNHSLIFQTGSKGYNLGEFSLKPPFQDDTLSYAHRFYEMNASFDPGCAEIQKIISVFKNDLQSLKEEPEKKTSVSKFQTYPQCAKCHVKQYEVWKKSNHAQAFLSLYSMNQHFNKDCAVCHTVGLGQDGGISNLHKATMKGESFVSQVQLSRSALEKIKKEKNMLEASREFHKNPQIYKELKKLYRESLEKQGLDRDYWGVQCENCHGARKGHPFSKAHFPKFLPGICSSCHTKSQSPHFDIKSYLRVEGKHTKGQFDFICAMGKPAPLKSKNSRD